MPFKSTEDVDREIARLEAQVNGGMMKLVDEKKALAEISSLRKTRKNFSQFDDAQKQIDDLRAKIKEIKDSMDDPEAKALSEQYTKIQAELDVIKAEQDEAYKSLSSLRDERTKLQAEQSEKFQAIRKLKDEYHTARKAFAEYEKERRARDRERQQAERDRIAKERRMERAQKMLAEASDPAYLEEIRRANSLLHFFDPSHVADKSTPLLANKGLGAEAQRKVDESGIKGTKLVSKKDRDEDLFAPAKKGKKGKKAPAEPASKTFQVPPSVIEDCAFIGVDPPMSPADVPAVTEKVKAKLENWKKEQPEQTKRVCFVSLPLSVENMILTFFHRTSRRQRRRSSVSKPRSRAPPPAPPPPTAPRTARRTRRTRPWPRSPKASRMSLSRTRRRRRSRHRSLHLHLTNHAISRSRICSVVGLQSRISIDHPKRGKLG